MLFSILFPLFEKEIFAFIKKMFICNILILKGYIYMFISLFLSLLKNVFGVNK